MNCDQARERILESLDEAAGAHCPDCAAFLDAQRAIDAALSARFSAVTLPVRTRNAIGAEVRARRRAARWEALPDLLHGAGCAAVAGMAIWAIPSFSITAALLSAAVSYVALSTLRGWMEEG